MEKLEAAFEGFKSKDGGQRSRRASCSKALYRFVRAGRRTRDLLLQLPKALPPTMIED